MELMLQHEVNPEDLQAIAAAFKKKTQIAFECKNFIRLIREYIEVTPCTCEYTKTEDGVLLPYTECWRCVFEYNLRSFYQATEGK